jgi:hypothetical protein
MPGQAQQSDYSGTWLLNMAKSQLQDMDEGFTGSRFIIEQKGEKIKFTRYHYYGKKHNRISFKIRADGKTRTIKLLFKGKLEWQGEQLKATLTRKHFLNVVHYRFRSDENEFIADETFTGLPGIITISGSLTVPCSPVQPSAGVNTVP